jgi:hypothetical protein
MVSLKSKKDLGFTKKWNEVEEVPKNSLYETSQHLLFSNYLLTCLKARDHKTELLYTLNAFRAVQKRIAIELRELGSRDRVTFDCNIVKPKEKTGSGIHNLDEADGDTNNENMIQSGIQSKK